MSTATARPLALLPLIAVALLALACRATPAGEPAAVGAWTLAELEGADLTPLAGGGRRMPTLEITGDGALHGFAGVNSFSASVDLDALRDGRFVATPVVATLMAGPPEAMAVEDRLLEVLEAAGHARVEDGELVLSAGDGVLARFVPRD